jgi:hypothetical protein
MAQKQTMSRRPLNSIVALDTPTLALRGVFGFLLLLICAAFVPRLATASDFRTVPTVSPAPGSSFAIADLDGDHRPDLATVQPGHGSRGSAYLVGLHLSETGRHYIRVTGPAGGLRVEARDVNGDNSIDLVFASAWLDRPVAILLNDGHGNFSQVDPSAFPQAFTDSNAKWNSSSVRYSCALGLPRRSSTGEISLACHADKIQIDTECLPRADRKLSTDSSNSLHAGRAPPPAILL